MNFLETGNEDFATVAEAIAFIDSFDDGVQSNDSSSDSGTVHPVAKSRAPKRKRRSNPPGYTTRVQQRKKAELQNLRDHVRELELQIEQLKVMRSPSMATSLAGGLDSATKSKWKQLVEIEYNERRRAEETNRKLKEILALQADVDKNFRRVLQKKTVLQGIDFVFGNEPTSRYSFNAFENGKAIMDHLEQKVAQHYRDSGSLFQSRTPPAINCSMQMKHVKGLGKTAEAISTTPMGCPMEAAALICWKDLTTHRPCPEKWERYMNGSQPDSREKNWILTLQCQSYVKQVKGVQFLRKYVEPNRIVIIKADLMTLTDEGLQFRDQCWTIITRSETDQNASVVRMCEQMYMDRSVEPSARAEDVEYAQNVVLKNLSWKLREHSQHLQDVLVEEYYTFDSTENVGY